MQPRRFELVPEVAPHVTVHVEDDRGSLAPDDDLLEIGIRFQGRQGAAIAVTLSVAELERLRDALTEIVNREFD